VVWRRSDGGGGGVPEIFRCLKHFDF